MDTRVLESPDLRRSVFLCTVRWGFFIMTVTLTQIGLMVILAVNALIVFSFFTAGTNHTIDKLMII